MRERISLLLISLGSRLGLGLKFGSVNAVAPTNSSACLVCTLSVPLLCPPIFIALKQIQFSLLRREDGRRRGGGYTFWELSSFACHATQEFWGHCSSFFFQWDHNFLRLLLVLQILDKHRRDYNILNQYIHITFTNSSKAGKGDFVLIFCNC